MRTVTCFSAFFIVLGVAAALAQTVPPDSAMKMEVEGSSAVDNDTNVAPPSDGLEQLTRDIPIDQLSRLAQSPISEAAGTVRSVKDAQLYRTISPSVVLVANKEGIGSGSLVSTSGDILTNWHVVSGYEYVAIIFKPTVEGAKPTRDDITLGRVVKYDEIADLALVSTAEVPAGRNPIQLGDAGEIAVGVDVHAIGHPTGEAWTYTKGVISQYRQGYEWRAGGDPIPHKADIIQTQTPINPGNSGGPLISEFGNLISVNSFKAAGEGLNFAVSIGRSKKVSSSTQEQNCPTGQKSEGHW